MLYEKILFSIKKKEREIITISYTQETEAGGFEFQPVWDISSRPAVDAAWESKEVGILHTDC